MDEIKIVAAASDQANTVFQCAHNTSSLGVGLHLTYLIGTALKDVVQLCTLCIIVNCQL